MTHGSIGGYRILRRLGGGGMGEVFLARQQSAAGLGRAVVIKVVSERNASDREARARFLDEARLALQLRHRNICGVTHVGEADGRTFLVMDYVAGRDVRDVLAALQERGRRISPALAIYILKEILDALDYAHRMVDPRTGASLGIVHRDVSPSNVMISLEGEVQLIDFGMAMSSWKVERTAAGRVRGKVRYMSPEQARGEAVDARSDVFSAAIVGTELFAGLPFREQMSDRALLEVTQGGERSPLLDLIDEDVRALLDRALTADREPRARAGEVVRACEELLVARRDVVGPADVRTMMREIFPEELARQRERLAEVLDDGASPQGNTNEVIFFSRLEAAVNEPRSPREVTQIVRTRGATKPITTTEDATDLGGIKTRISDEPTLLAQDALPSSSTQPVHIGSDTRSRIMTLAAGAAAIIVVVVAVAWLARDESTALALVVDAGASPVAVVVVDAGAVDAPVVDAPVADAGAVDEPAIDEPAIDEPAVDQPAVDQPIATPKRVVKKYPPVSSMSLQQKLAALKSCGARTAGNACAKSLLARGAAHKSADETRLFLAEVDRCVVQCRR